MRSLDGVWVYIIRPQLNMSFYVNLLS